MIFIVWNNCAFVVTFVHSLANLLFSHCSLSLSLSFSLFLSYGLRLCRVSQLRIFDLVRSSNFSDCVHKMAMNKSRNLMDWRVSNRHIFTHTHTHTPKRLIRGVNEWQWCQWKFFLFGFMHKCFIYLRFKQFLLLVIHAFIYTQYHFRSNVRFTFFFCFGCSQLFVFIRKIVLFVWLQVVF